MSPATADLKELRECGVPLSDAVRRVAATYVGLTVGQVFQYAREAGYLGIIEDRKPRPKDGTPCPECSSTNTWESAEGPSVLYCRNCIEHYTLS
jgi:formamidopyrimidine-DNA glycosylase